MASKANRDDKLDKMWRNSLNYELPSEAFINQQIHEFLLVSCFSKIKFAQSILFFHFKEVARTRAVNESMGLGPLLATTAQAMKNSTVFSLKMSSIQISHFNSSLQLIFGPDWKVPVNIFVMIVSEKGSGKSPTVGVFMKPLEKIESEELSEEHRASKRKSSEKVKARKKGPAGDRRSRDGDVQDELLAATPTEEDEDEPEESEEETELTAESRKFPKATRILDSVTPQGKLIENIYDDFT